MEERGVGRPERAARRGGAGGLWLASALRRALPCLALALACLTGATGRARAQGFFDASPDPVQFPPTAVGSQSDMVVTITNDGTTDLVISAYSQSGDGAFPMSEDDQNYPLILAGNSNDIVTYHMRFIPATIGPHTATMYFKTNGTPSQQTVTLQGTGVAPTPGISVSPTTLDFGQQRVGTDSAGKPFTITNTGNVPVDILLSRAGDGGDFHEVHSSYTTLYDGQSLTVTYFFKPTAPGPRSASVIVAYVLSGVNNATPSQQYVNLTGTGVSPTPPPSPPLISVSPTSLDFGSVPVGAQATRSVTISNSGGSDLLVSSIDGSLPGAEFSLSSSSLPAIPPGGSATWSLTFHPTRVENLDLYVDFHHNAAGASTRVFVMANGIPASSPTPTPTPTPSPPPVIGPSVTGYAATNPKGVPIASGPSGAPLLIVGSNFGTGGSVAFSGIPTAPATSWSPTEIVVTIPTAPSYPFTGPVTVTVNGQTAAGPPFSILAPANPTPAPVVSVDWPVFGHDPQQLGSTSSALDPRTLGPWSFALGSKPGLAPVVAGGVAYAGTESNGVFAVDTTAHTQKWNRPLPAPVRSAPAVGAGVVVVSAHGLYGLSPKDGTNLWPPRLDLAARDSVSPMLAGDTVYLGAAGPGGFGEALYAVKAATGKDVWASPAILPAAALSTAAVDPGAGRLFVAIGTPAAAGQPPAGPSAVVALRTEDGRSLWPAPAVFPNAPAAGGLSLGTVTAGGAVVPAVFVAAGNSVTALNAATGAVLWSHLLPETVFSAPPVILPALLAPTLFIGGSSGKVYAVAANTGTDAPGGLATPLAPITGSMALAGPLLFVPTSAGLIAVDTTSGTKVWTGDGEIASGVAIAGGSLYVGTGDGRLVGFSPGAAPPAQPPANPTPTPGTVDLALTGIQVPATVSRSSDALVKVTLVNRGGGSASYSLTLRVQPGNTLLGAATGTLAVGETREVPFTWATGFMGSDGVKVLLAQVELVGATDSHPEDDILTQPVTVGP